MSYELYNAICSFGDICQTSFRVVNYGSFVDWTEENFIYKPYNSRDANNRFGLSLTSLDGELSGVPDLDSLYEYNKEHGTSYGELDFRTFTKVFEYKEINDIFKPIKKYIGRSHVLKIMPGGFFPAHRDYNSLNIASFRILIPLTDMNPNTTFFLLEDKLQTWSLGYLYFVNTAREHTLFNAGYTPSYMIVLNIELNKKTAGFILSNLKSR